VASVDEGFGGDAVAVPEAGPDGDVDVDALGDEPGGDIDDVVFPADLSADATDVGVEDLEVAGVAAAPPGALDEGGDELAVAAHDFAVFVDVDEGVEEGAAADAVIEFVAAHDDVSAGVAGGAAELVGVFAVDDEGVVLQDGHDVVEVSGGGVPAHRPIRVGWDPGFGEDDDVGAFLAGFDDEVAGLFDAAGLVHEDRGCLHNGGADLFSSPEYLCSHHEPPRE